MTDAFEKLKNKTEEKVKEIYGENLPALIRERLEFELSSIEKQGAAKYFTTASEIVVDVLRRGYNATVKGVTASSFVLYLLGVTDVNPLPAHYICNSCTYCEFNDEKMCGVDLEDKVCPECGKNLTKDGHTLPCEFFTGVNGEKPPGIIISIPPEIYDEIYSENAGVYIEKLDVMSMLKALEEITDLKQSDIPLGDEKTLKILSDGRVFGIPFINSEYSQNIIATAGLNSFDDLLRISGLSHGVSVWYDNAEDIIANKTATLQEVISTREDVFIHLLKGGASRKDAFDITEKVRKAKLSDSKPDIMSNYNLPSWFEDSCKKILYLYPRGHAAALAKITYCAAYYKTHYPAEFCCVCLNSAKDKIIPEILTGVIEKLKNLSKVLDNKFAAFDVGDDSNQEVLDKLYCGKDMIKLLEEMVESGIEINISNPEYDYVDEFKVCDEKIHVITSEEPNPCFTGHDLFENIKYSGKIASGWRSYLEFSGYKYKFDQKRGTLFFGMPCATVCEELEITVKIGLNYYCVYAKFPLIFSNDTIDAVSSYINQENTHTLLANFTIDYDAKSAYNVISNFCGNNEPDAEEIESHINCICSHVESYYEKLSLMAKLNDKKCHKKSLPNSAGLDCFCKNYLDKKEISYSLHSDNEKYNHLVAFTEDEIRFSVLIEDDYVIADASGCVIPFLNEETLYQVKEYIQRCNHEIGHVRFVLYGVIGSHLNITCRYESFFSKKTIDATLICGTEELKKVMKTSYLGLIEVGLGKLTAKEAFLKYCPKDDVDE